MKYGLLVQAILLLIVGQLFVQQNVFADEADTAVQDVQSVDCAQVENARERLACFDAQNPRNENRPPVKLVTEPIRYRNQPDLSTQQVGEATNDASQKSKATKAAEDAPIRGSGGDSGGFFGKRTKVDFSSEIEAVKREDQKKMVFRLANGQIWIQSSPRDLPIRKGDIATIKSGTIGGFVLQTNKGATTRVNRIK